jgi:ABC-type sugar transport system permease subunit
MPRRKTRTSGTAIVAGGGLGGAIATIITWAAKQFFDVDIPPNVAAAMATILIFIGGLIGKKL